MPLSENSETTIQRCLIALLAAFAVSILMMVMLKNYNLRTNFYDLGQYATILYSYHHAGLATYLFATHAQPLIAPLSWIYAVFGSPVALQLIGAATVFAGVYFSIICFTRPGIERCLGALVFAVSPVTWYAILFDFHFEVFLFCLIPAFFSLAENRGHKPYSGLMLLVIAATIAAVKEPYALLSLSLGIWLVVRQRRHALGIAIAVSGLAYFLYATTKLIPYFTEYKSTGEIWSNAFGHLGGSPLEIISTLALSPKPVVATLLTSAKLLYAGLLILPFLPGIRRNPSFIIPAIPTLLISLLSANDNHVGISHQYATATFLPLVIGSLITARTQSRAGMLQTYAAIGGMCLSTLIIFGPSPLSRLFWNQKVWQYELEAYVPDDRSRQIRTAIDEFIPENPSYVVSMQNTVQTARLSNRYYAMAFPNGVFDAFVTPDNSPESPTMPWKWAKVRADYVIIDLKRPYFIRDKGCDWLWGKCQAIEDERTFLNLVEALSADFDLLFEYDGFKIYQRSDARK